MAKSIICRCGFKYREVPSCPICGRVEEVTRKKPHYMKRVSRSKNRKNLAEVMRTFIKEKYPDWVPGMILNCSNCGREIRELKFANISHIDSRGSRPDKRYDMDNMELLCSSLDYIDEKDAKDESCHTLWERGRVDDFQKKSR